MELTNIKEFFMGPISNPANKPTSAQTTEEIAYSKDVDNKIGSGSSSSGTHYSNLESESFFAVNQVMPGIVSNPAAGGFDMAALIKSLELESDDSNLGVQEESIKSNKLKVKAQTDKNVESLEKVENGHQENRDCGTAMVTLGVFFGVLLAPFTAGASLALAAPLVGVGADKIIKGNQGLDAVNAEANKTLEARYEMDYEIVSEWIDDYSKEQDHIDKLGQNNESKKKMQESLGELFQDLEILSESEYQLMSKAVDENVLANDLRLMLSSHINQNVK